MQYYKLHIIEALQIIPLWAEIHLDTFFFFFLHFIKQIDGIRDLRANNRQY